METVLSEAEKLVSGTRREDYGDAFECQNAVAKMWSIYLRDKLKTDITAEDTCMMMVLMKLVRQSMRPKRDNIVDIAGYSRVHEMCEETRARLKKPWVDPPEVKIVPFTKEA